MEAHTSSHEASDTRKKRVAPSLKGPTWGFGITAGLLVIAFGAAAASLSVYRGIFMYWGIWGILCFVAICFYLARVYRMISSKAWRGVFLIVAIAVGLLLAPMITVESGIMVASIHASRAQKDAVPVLAFIESERAKTGALPNHILPALDKITDPSRMMYVWYTRSWHTHSKKDYELSVWVASFYCFEPHPVITVYSSKQGTWSGPRLAPALWNPGDTTTVRYEYEATTGRWKVEIVYK
ncbi:MAG: hypothetical protein AB1646_11160 [Thermodesulfobacteriota bacterium]